METSGAATISRPDEMFRCATGVVAAADQESGKVSRARRAEPRLVAADRPDSPSLDVPTVARPSKVGAATSDADKPDL